MNILGLSAFYHDSAAALIRDGEIIACAQEERFTRRKNDPAFPRHATRYCLQQAGIGLDAVDYVVFYDKPLLKFDRILQTHLALAPRTLPAFVRSMPVWLKEKLFQKRLIRERLAELGGPLPPLLFAAHHAAHAASAFYPSPYPEAAVLCLDGVGEWATTSAWHGHGHRLTPLWQQDFPHSLGLLYSAFTAYCGFRVNSGEYKLMGLAPYGEPRHVQRILDELIDLKDDGSFRLDLNYFDFAGTRRMTTERFHRLFGGPPREPEGELQQHHMDIAASIQAVTEEIVHRLATTLHRETGLDHLCLAGGVALNCVANGKLRTQGPYRDIWIQPAAGDAGGALGAALLAWHHHLDRPRHPSQPDAMQGALLGPEYDTDTIETTLRQAGARYRRLDPDALDHTVAEALDQGRVVGWFQGRAEFGPRALGNRSILGDPRPPEMQSRINLKIKFRESFRPFAPAVLAEHQAEWFEMERPSPYMLFVSPLKAQHLRPLPQQARGLDKLRHPRSPVAAVTHVDGSARLQSVHPQTHPRFHRLIQAFHRRSGCPMVVNTSFNIRGEPIVLTPRDALRCFARTDMDLLAIGDFLVDKRDQPPELAQRLDAPPPPPEPEHPPLPEATPKRLRQFALSTAAAVVLLFGLLIPWLTAHPIPLWLIAAAGAWALWGLLLPTSLTPLYHGWLRFGLLMGRITTPVILTVVYCLLVTPLGWLRRALGHDPMERRRDPQAASYRRPSPPLSGMDKPF